MTIETKYNIGDKVWWKCKDGTIHCGIIGAIRVNVYDQETNVGIQYGIKHDIYGCDYEWFWNFYSTKKELLKSL